MVIFHSFLYVCQRLFGEDVPAWAVLVTGHGELCGRPVGSPRGEPISGFLALERYKVVPPQLISWFIIPSNYRYRPHKP